MDEFSEFEIIKISVFVRFTLNNDTFIEVKLSLSNFLKLITSDNFTQLLIKLIEYNQFDIWKIFIFNNRWWIFDYRKHFMNKYSIKSSYWNIKKNKYQEIKYHKKVIYSTNRLNLSIKSLCLD